MTAANGLALGQLGLVLAYIVQSIRFAAFERRLARLQKALTAQRFWEWQDK